MHLILRNDEQARHACELRAGTGSWLCFPKTRGGRGGWTGEDVALRGVRRGRAARRGRCALGSPQPTPRTRWSS